MKKQKKVTANELKKIRQQVQEEIDAAVELARQSPLPEPEVLMDDLDTELAQTAYEVVYQEDRVKLKHCLPRTEIRYQTPLLVTYALINRETMLDLQPGRSVVERFLAAGIDLYMIDWGYPTRKDRFLGFDDHIPQPRTGRNAELVEDVGARKVPAGAERPAKPAD